MKLRRATICLVVLACSMQATPGLSTVPDTLKQKIDSLIRVANSSQGLQKYEAEFLIAYDLFDVDNNVAATHAAIAYEVAQEEKDTAKIVKSGRLYGQLLRRVSSLDDAIDVFLKVLPLSERMKDNVENGRILNALAVAYTLRASFDKALIYHFKCLHLMQANRDSVKMGDSYNNIGFIYYVMANHWEAASYFERAIALGDSSNASNAFLNLALNRLYLNELTSFPDLARRGLAMTPRHEVPTRLGSYEFGFGFFYEKTGMLDSAESRYRKCLAIGRELDDARLVAEIEMHIATCAGLRGDFDLELSMLRDVEQDISGLKYHSVRRTCYENLSSALEKKELWKESLKYKSMQLALQDSLFSQNTLNNMAVARVEFEARENELMIQKQAEIIGLRESRIVKQRWLIAAAATIVCLLIGFVLLLYRYLQWHRTIASELDRKVFERTRELQTSEDVLKRSLGEQRAMMDLVSRKVQASIASFRGLWHVNRVEPIDPCAVNERFEATVKELLQVSIIVDRSIDMRSAMDDGPYVVVLPSKVVDFGFPD